MSCSFIFAWGSKIVAWPWKGQLFTDNGVADPHFIPLHEKKLIFSQIVELKTGAFVWAKSYLSIGKGVADMVPPCRVEAQIEKCMLSVCTSEFCATVDIAATRGLFDEEKIPSFLILCPWGRKKISSQSFLPTWNLKDFHIIVLILTLVNLFYII